MTDDRQVELERLRRQNAALSEQIQLRVQTEQRLDGLRQTLDRQLSRVRDLGNFALDSARLDDPGDILDRALLLLLDNFSLDSVTAVRAHPQAERLSLSSWPGGRRAEIAAPGRGRMLDWVQSLPKTAMLPADDAFLDRFRPVLDAILPAAAASGALDPIAVCMPLRAADETLSGFILALRITGQDGPHYREPLSDGLLPFLQLLANHLEHALQNAGLTSELRNRGRQLGDANRQLKASLENLERTQQQLVQAKKMEAVGRLAGGIAHDFNNLLTVILGHAQLLHDRQPALSRDLQDAEQIIEAGNRAAAIVGQLLAFSRKQKKSDEIIDLNDLARSMSRMLGRLIGEHISLQLVTDPGIARIRADRSHLEQIVMNLVVNARDAMPGGGTVSIRTFPPTRQDLIDLGQDDDGRGYVALSIADTGHGMDHATCAQIFEPFFSTKEADGTTGMGLAIVYGLVKQNDGQIRVKSEVDRGSCFTLLFSAAAEPALAVPADGRAKSESTPTATILLAEDEPNIRRLFSEVLAAEGFHVLQAADGAQALDVARRHRGRIDLLVCDVVMPRIGGVEVFRDLRAENPNLPVLFISGYTFDSLKAGELEGEPYLQKPFMPTDLVERIRQILRRKRLRLIKLPEEAG